MNEIITEIPYPEAIRDAGYEGKVSFRLLIDENGFCVSWLALGEVEHLTEICSAYLTLLKYAPMYFEGKRVKFFTNLTFHFDSRRGGPGFFYRQEEVVTDREFSE